MTWLIENVFPLPVTPSRTWSLRPFARPSLSDSIALGWSPVGSNGATSLKTGMSASVYQPQHEPNGRSTGLTECRPEKEQPDDGQPDERLTAPRLTSALRPEIDGPSRGGQIAHEGRSVWRSIVSAIPVTKARVDAASPDVSIMRVATGLTRLASPA